MNQSQFGKYDGCLSGSDVICTGETLMAKKTWSTPAVKVYGTVEEITRQSKEFGADDGFPFTVINPINGQPGTIGFPS